MTFRVTETIHHGQYYNVAESVGATARDAFVAALATSPYNMTATFDNRYVAECYDDLVLVGRGDFGWARYTLTEEP